MSEHCPKPCLVCNRLIKFGDDVMVVSASVGRMYFHLKCARFLANRLWHEARKPEQHAAAKVSDE